MSLEIAHYGGALVVTVPPGAASQRLPHVCDALTRLVNDGDAVVVDVSEVTLAPTAQVTRFVQNLPRQHPDSGVRYVIVARRLTARHVLAALAFQGTIAIAANIADALEFVTDRRRLVPQARQASP